MFLVCWLPLIVTFSLVSCVPSFLVLTYLPPYPVCTCIYRQACTILCAISLHLSLPLRFPIDSPISPCPIKFRPHSGGPVGTPLFNRIEVLGAIELEIRDPTNRSAVCLAHRVKHRERSDLVQVDVQTRYATYEIWSFLRFKMNNPLALDPVEVDLVASGNKTLQ